MPHRAHHRAWTLWPMVGLALLCAFLLWYDLGAREVLGRDENLTIVKLDQPNLLATIEAISIKATGKQSNMQPLYFLIQRLFWPLVGHSAFMLRFLSSALGLLVVIMTYKLGETLWGSEVGLAGALFTALLPLHVRYAQIARPYTMVAFLALASAFFLVRSLSTDRVVPWVGFVLAAVLLFYTHICGLCALAAEGLFAGLAWLTMLTQVRRKQQPPGRLVRPILAFLSVGILCLPGLVWLFRLPWVGTGGEVRVQFTITFFQELLSKFGLRTPLLRSLVAALALVGLMATLYRRRWQTTPFAVLWIATPFVILSVLKSPRPFAERYVIFVPPVALLLVGQGVVTLGQWAGNLGRTWGQRGVRPAAIVLLSAGLAVLFIAPLRTYYAAGRDADRLGPNVAVIERHVQPDDLVIISPRFFVSPFDTNGAEVRCLTGHLSLSEFEDLLSSHPRTWILYTSYLPARVLQEPLDQWILARPDNFARVPIKAITAMAYYNHALTDPEEQFLDRIVLLEDLALSSIGRQEAWLPYGALAQAHESLSELYAEQGEPTLAAEHRRLAEEIRAAAPPP